MRPREPRIHGVASWALVALACAPAAACGPAAEVPVPAAPYAGMTGAERRAALRVHLRAVLGEDYHASLPAVTEEGLTRGAELYGLLCSNCHGSGGGGTRQLSQMLPIQPGDLRDPERAAFFSDRAQLEIISAGIEGTPMVGWEDLLSESELRAVLAHVQTLVSARGRGGS